MTTRISIFHIDDNPGDLTLANEAFSSHREVAYMGIEQPISGLARVASETIAGRPPSLILLDLNLPGFQGTEVLRLLHANEHLEKIPVVVFTSSTMQHERESCLQLGATAVMTKPATFEELCALTATIMRLIPASGAAGVQGSTVAPPSDTAPQAPACGCAAHASASDDQGPVDSSEPSMARRKPASRAG